MTPDGTERTIGYSSRLVNDVECAEEAAHWECLVVASALLMHQNWLGGSQFPVRTDHNASQWILNLMDSINKLVYWRLRLFKFEFHVFYCAGIRHQVTDELSQLKTTGTDQAPINNDITVLCITPSRIPEEKDESVSFKQDNKVIDDKGGTGLHAE